ncbi:hypothetical protein [Amycolatopsis suaedae]|uniref:Uncharacterized protein n=1 Tax=Amycolatopsis suaedae TaxID=2510978 RepID=A0A4Q7J9D3_9PSEU|nr:hypothetical protein [Amycolatopsis suaedae]RZQ63536.1 hypothetical protein EWH70_14015 [Amycolatopsis suaedae]
MPRGTTAKVVAKLRGSRSGTVPMVAAVASALALTGAAFYTVEHAGCFNAGQYIRHDSHIELVGGCVDGSQLPGVAPTPKPDPVEAEHSNYRP